MIDGGVNEKLDAMEGKRSMRGPSEISMKPHRCVGLIIETLAENCTWKRHVTKVSSVADT